MLTRLCLNRPVGVTAFYLLLSVLAIAAVVRLPVALLPDLEYPGLVVWTGYPDVPPERVERAVTERIEEAVSGIAGLEQVTSRSTLGGSFVRLDFGWNVNLDFAFLQAREQIDRIGNVLPDEADRPAVLRLNPSDRPIMMIAVQGVDLVQLKRIARDVVARRLEAIPDVARVQVTGGYDPQIEVQIDADQLLAYGLDINRLSGALQNANVALPGGMIRRGPFRYAVEVSGEFTSIEDIARTVVARTPGQIVRLSDVAEIKETVADRRGMVRFNGAETLLLLVERRPDANTVRAAEEIHIRLDELEAELSGVAFNVVVDESTFIEEAIGGVTQAVWLGGVLALVILLVFLRRPRVLLAIAIAVPLSIGITFILFDLLGITFNLISLSGLALGVGLLLDNAIIVVENIARLREKGLAPVEAAYQGTREVIGAITASTLTTIAVFLPITFIEGLAGRLFRDQSMAVVCSLLASLLVAATVVPLIVSRQTGRSETSTKIKTGGSVYEQALTWCLAYPTRVLGAALLLLTLSSWLALQLPREVIPRTDQGRLIVRFRLPADSDLPIVLTRATLIESWLEGAEVAEGVLADLGERDEYRFELDPRPAYEGDLLVLTRSHTSVWEAAQNVEAFPWPADLTASVQPVRTQLEALLAPDNADLLIDLQADDRAIAESQVAPLVALLETAAALTNIRRSDSEYIPAYSIELDEDAMTRFGVQPAQLTAYLEAGARGRRATDLRGINEDVPIVIRARYVNSIDALLAERVPTPNGLLPLSEFVTVERIELPAALIRAGQTPVVRLEADLTPGYGVAQGEKAAMDALGTLPIGIRGRVGGASEAFQSGLRAVGLSMLVSLLLVFLILAAQFESFVHPIIILASVPLALIGVVAVLAISGTSINLMSLTGAVVLVGIVVNDAIIKVDFINQRRQNGLPLMKAIHEAGRDRLRPILMTTFTTMLGMLPLVWASGEGSELRSALALAIVGGLFTATVLTLLVVPVLYYTLTK